ncbi:hypothetical protein CSB37_00855 [bacterium DOLZORAL124_38_8]|nr:MAG: hypothetical protein CSB37_00855 [bacterium DOLZORAL124_38_8]
MKNIRLLSLLGFLGGTFLQPWIQADISLLVGILSLTIFGFIWFRKIHPLKNACGVLALFVGGLIYPTFFQTPRFPPTQLKKELSYEGIIISAPETKSRHQQVITNLTHPTQQTVLIQFPLETPLFYGQKIQFTGVASIPPKFNRFDYARYLQRLNISAIVRAKSHPKLLATNQASSFVFSAQKLRHIIQSNLEKIFPSDQATVATGMLLGVKKSLSKTADQQFRNAGLTHLLVVSGANVSLIIVLVSLALQPLGRPITFFGSMATILFFIGMTGADPPIIRASLMGGLIALAPLVGRIPDYKITLVFSAVLIALVNPKIVQQDIGFFLSFVATAGIILGSPIFMFYWEKLFQQRFSILKNILAVTVCAQIFVLPISAYFFQNFPLGGFIANIVAEPIVPLITIGSLGISVLGFLPTIIGKIIAFPIYFFLKILFLIAEIFSQIPSISINQTMSQILIILEVVIILHLLLSEKIERTFYLNEFKLC